MISLKSSLFGNVKGQHSAITDLPMELLDFRILSKDEKSCAQLTGTLCFDISIYMENIPIQSEQLAQTA